jgi:coenzyme F420-0:L-glutamate ligase / coenzyme F420-1:gamma-L-glutamate ligase
VSLLDVFRQLTMIAVPDFPLVEPGDDLAGLIRDACVRAAIGINDGDIVVIAQKIVSKAEDRYVDLADVTPSARARDLAAQLKKDPRLVELVLAESTEVIRAQNTVLIVAHRLGYIMANAGIDQSNISHDKGERALLLPLDPDGSAVKIKRQLDAALGIQCGVVINDSFGRPWRNGVVGVALGAAGVDALQSRVDAPDLFGRPLRHTEIAIADEIASAASLLMGQADEACPVVLIKGLGHAATPRPAAALIRPAAQDMFR